MILTYNGITVPEEWKHDALLTNKYGQTVAIIYIENGSIPPRKW